jgi:hypothetical protein
MSNLRKTQKRNRSCQKRRFPHEKRAIFREVKEIKRERGGVRQYAAQVNAQIDAEIAEKGRFSCGNQESVGLNEP